MSDIYKEILYYKKLLEKQKAAIDKFLAKAPEGYLKIDNRKGGPLFFIRTYENGVEKLKLIKKNEEKVLEKYVNMRFAKKAIKRIELNIKACEKFLKAHSQMDLEDIALLYPESFRKTNTLYKDREIMIQEWMSAEYRRNQYKPENLVYRASDGSTYRSKAEVMIAEVLMKYKVPFRYECELWLDDAKYPIYPDFTILNPNDMKEWYLEHFGMMDNPEYSRNAIDKINSYALAGFVPGFRFMYTMETANVPLSMDYIERMVKDLFVKKEYVNKRIIV